MRKIAWIIAAALGLSLAGCGGGGGSGTGTNSATTLNAPAGASSPAPASGTNSSAPNVLAADASAVPTPAGPGNTIAVTVTGTSIHNQPMVSVTLCTGGSNAHANCATIPNVIVDTESFGLRPRSLGDSGHHLQCADTRKKTRTSERSPLAECALFGSGYAWGTVHLADVAISGEIAPNLPIQVIGDTALTVPAPTECQVGRALVTTSDLGANGILGIGVSPTDCGTACVNGAVSTFYYTPTPAPVSAGAHHRTDHQSGHPVRAGQQWCNSGDGSGFRHRQRNGSGHAGLRHRRRRPTICCTAPAPRCSADEQGTATSPRPTTGPRRQRSFFDSGSTVMCPSRTCRSRLTARPDYYIPATTVGRSSTLVGAIPTSVSLGFNIANLNDADRIGE